MLVTPTGESDDGSAFGYNLRNVAFSSKTGYVNRPSFFSINDNNRPSYVNVPDNMPKSGTVVGYREVLYRNSTHILVKITEMHPTCGKQYYNFYNNGTWTGWKSIAPD